MPSFRKIVRNRSFTMTIYVTQSFIQFKKNKFQCSLLYLECSDNCATCILKSGTTDTSECETCDARYFLKSDKTCEGK